MTSTATTTGTLIERLVELAGPECSVHLWIWDDRAEVDIIGLSTDRYPELEIGERSAAVGVHVVHRPHGACIKTHARTLLVALQSAVQIMSTAPTYGHGLRLVPHGGA